MEEELITPMALSQNPSLTTRALSGLMWMSAGTIGQSLFQLATLAALTRLLDPAEFGLVSAALIVVGFSAIFAELGIGPSITQRQHLTTEHIRTGLTLSICLGILMTGCIWGGAGPLGRFLKVPGVESLLKVLSLLFVIQSLGVTATALLQREMKFRSLALIQMLSYTLGFGPVAIVLAWKGHGVWSIVWGHLCQTILQAVLPILIRRPDLRPGFHLRSAKELLHFGGGFASGRIANYGARQGDNLIVARQLGAEALGIYGRAYQLMMAQSQLFGTVLAKVLFPVMAQLQDDLPRLSKGYRRGIALVAAVVLPVSTLLIINARELVEVLLGKGWEDVVIPFQILAAASLFRTASKISDSVMRSSGHVYQRAGRQWLYLLLVVLGAFLGCGWKLPGVAWGVTMALGIHYVSMAQLSLSILQMSWSRFLRLHLTGTLLALVVLITSLPVTLMLRGMESPALLTAVLSSFAGIGVVILCCSIRPGFMPGPDITWVWDRVTGRIRRKQEFAG